MKKFLSLLPLLTLIVFANCDRATPIDPDVREVINLKEIILKGDQKAFEERVYVNARLFTSNDGKIEERRTVKGSITQLKEFLEKTSLSPDRVERKERPDLARENPGRRVNGDGWHSSKTTATELRFKDAAGNLQIALVLYRTESKGREPSDFSIGQSTRSPEYNTTTIDLGDVTLFNTEVPREE